MTDNPQNAHGPPLSRVLQKETELGSETGGSGPTHLLCEQASGERGTPRSCAVNRVAWPHTFLTLPGTGLRPPAVTCFLLPPKASGYRPLPRVQPPVRLLTARENRRLDPAFVLLTAGESSRCSSPQGHTEAPAGKAKSRDALPSDLDGAKISSCLLRCARAGSSWRGTVPRRAPRAAERRCGRAVQLAPLTKAPGRGLSPASACWPDVGDTDFRTGCLRVPLSVSSVSWVREGHTRR